LGRRATALRFSIGGNWRSVGWPARRFDSSNTRWSPRSHSYVLDGRFPSEPGTPSSIEACFDFDTGEGEEPEPYDQCASEANIRVQDDGQTSGDDVLARCFRFRYERSWHDYYARAHLSDAHTEALRWHTLGTIAMDIPMLLAFFLLLSTRSGLPQQRRDHTRLNRNRGRLNRAPLLDHIEVQAPILPAYAEHNRSLAHSVRRSPRLHHVRGHLMRHGSELIWRVPHLHGCARSGQVQTRTVVWTFDSPAQAGRRARPRSPDISAPVASSKERARNLH
jgi:hypothetical protein